MVNEEIYSATDHDIFVRMINTLALVVATDYVDYTTSFWAAPKVANNGLSSQFLVVAEKTLSGGAVVIFGRTVAADEPDRDGRPVPDQRGRARDQEPIPTSAEIPARIWPTYYCVCWQSTIGSNKNVYYNLVRDDNSLVFSNNPTTPFLGSPTANTEQQAFDLEV